MTYSNNRTNIIETICGDSVSGTNVYQRKKKGNLLDQNDNLLDQRGNLIEQMWTVDNYSQNIDLEKILYYKDGRLIKVIMRKINPNPKIIVYEATYYLDDDEIIKATGELTKKYTSKDILKCTGKYNSSFCVP